MDNNVEFISLYQKLEMYLNAKYPFAESPIKEYIHALEKSLVISDVETSSTLDFLRTLRNNIVHRDVSSYVLVTDEALKFLRSIIDKFENPSYAENVMVDIKKVYYVYLSDNTLDVLDEIYKNSYDLLPLLDEEDKVIGVFSLEVILKSIYQNKNGIITKESTLNDFKDLMGLNDQQKVSFDFVSRKDSLDTIIEKFNKKNNKKVKMLFVTKNGLTKEPLLGIITPHDIIFKK